ncbi:MAG: FHA domain-containing protein [Bryobacterales bacterium]|nr:FHA domain-containing protein [Bryobacterales bacterium]
MIRCNEGHFYDPAKHTSCPWCGQRIDIGARIPETVPVRPGPADPLKTVPVAPPTAPPAAVPAPAPQAVGKTVRLVREQLGIDPVVGWLVCMEGPDRGKDYRLHSEKNFIGRAASMDVCVSGDDAISREKHAVVTFEPKKQTFWLSPGESSGLVYLNGDILHLPAPLKDRDVIEIGKTKLVLVPFVSGEFRWE